MMTFNRSRRKVLSHILKAASAYSFLPLLETALENSSLAWGESISQKPDHFLVFISMPGGWDTTLSLDPWVGESRPDSKDLFLEYQASQLISAGPLILGPAMESFKSYGNDLCIINGVFMSSVDNGHPASLSYITTGNAVGAKPDLAVELAASTPKTAFGLFTNTLVQTKLRAQQLTPFNEIKKLRGASDPTPRMQELLRTQEGSSEFFSAARSVAGSQAVVKELVEHLANLTQDMGRDLALVLRAAFLSGACSTARLDLSENEGFGFLDTHANHPGSHLANQKKRWDWLADLFKLFKETPYGDGGESLFDRTTFVAVSEFSRTAALNASNGKDHNPYTNSVLLAGRRIAGGQRLGKSKLIDRKTSAKKSSYQIAVPFDFNAGEAVDSPQGTQFLFPDHIARTIAEAAQVDWGVFSSVPKELPLLKKALR